MIDILRIFIASRKIEWLTQGTWETPAGGFSPDGKTLTWVANIDGQREIFLYDLAARQAQALPLQKGTNRLGGAESSFTRDGTKILFFHSGADSPRDVWVYSLATRQSHPVTQSLVGGVRGEDLVEPFLVHYSSADGKWQISAFVYVPHNLERDAMKRIAGFLKKTRTAEKRAPAGWIVNRRAGATLCLPISVLFTYM